MAGQEKAVEINSKRVKIIFKLDSADTRGVQSESVWAERISEKEYFLLNSPFFVFGVSSDDVVLALEEHGAFVFKDVVAQGGHSTYRLFLIGGLTTSSEAFMKLWNQISELGATYENANDTFVAVDIPPKRDIIAIYGLFERGEQAGVWIFEEGNYESATNE